jgi:glucokinase
MRCIKGVDVTVDIESHPWTSNSVIALDLGGTKLAAALCTADGKLLNRRTVALDERQGDAVAKLVVGEARRLLEAAIEHKLDVAGAGVCVPGVVRAGSGRVWTPNIPGWEDYPLRDELAAALPCPAAAIMVDNDRASSILGEAWQGAARGVRHAILLAVGTGIGAGIMVDGRVLDGAHGVSGAVGWWALDRPYLAEYAACGCFESHASGDGLAKIFKAFAAQSSTYRGALYGKFELTAHDVFAAYDRGDELAERVIQQAVEFWGMASANLVSLFNPEIIVFGGGVFGPAARLIDAIAAEARRWAQPVAIEQVRFVQSQLGVDAALYGAAYLAMHGRRAPQA